MSYTVLIVDDEKNIRLTLTHCLAPMNLVVETAVNGEEALSRIETRNYDLVLLDLKMPGMSGMEVLQRMREMRPEIPIIVITAHGTIDSAVDAMKKGVVDFIQKPFAPNEIRDLVDQVIKRYHDPDQRDADYMDRIHMAKESITRQYLDSATENAKAAIALDPDRPDAYNIMGVIMELLGDRPAARRYFRTALTLDPSCTKARQNLEKLENPGE